MKVSIFYAWTRRLLAALRRNNMQRVNEIAKVLDDEFQRLDRREANGWKLPWTFN